MRTAPTCGQANGTLSKSKQTLKHSSNLRLARRDHVLLLLISLRRIRCVGNRYFHSLARFNLLSFPDCRFFDFRPAADLAPARSCASYKASERRDQILHSANEFLLFTPIFYLHSFIETVYPWKSKQRTEKIEIHIFMAVCYCIFSHESIAADGAARSGPSDCVRATFCRRTRPSDRLRMLIAPAEISQEIARAGVANF